MLRREGIVKSGRIVTAFILAWILFSVAASVFYAVSTQTKAGEQGNSFALHVCTSAVDGPALGAALFIVCLDVKSSLNGIARPAIAVQDETLTLFMYNDLRERVSGYANSGYNSIGMLIIGPMCKSQSMPLCDTHNRRRYKNLHASVIILTMSCHV